MSEAKVGPTNTSKTTQETPSKNNNKIVPTTKGSVIFVGKKSGTPYYDSYSDESDNESDSIVIAPLVTKVKNTPQLNSNTPILPESGGQKKTRRPRKSRRQTKKRRQIKKK